METTKKYVVVRENNELVFGKADWASAENFRVENNQYYDYLNTISYEEYPSKNENIEYESMINPVPSMTGNDIPRY